MRLAEDVQNVVRSEIELLKAEMREKAAAYGVAAGLAVGAAVLAVFALFALIFAAIVGLAEFMPLWLSALIVALVLLLLAALLVWLAGRSARKAQGLKPNQTIAEVEATVDTLREVQA